MAREVYEWVCHSCEERDVLKDLEEAQSQFSDHAERGCEVVLRNLSPSPTQRGRDDVDSPTVDSP